MSLKEKYNGTFLILITGIIIFAHAVIPHHHHFDSVEAHSENLECESTNTVKHNENPDTHCHAFNLIISEKANDIVVNSPATFISHFDLFSFDKDFLIASKLNDVIYPPFVSSLTQKQIFLSSRLLRAPPASA
ncbi:hypothetical protein [Sunxiuqinia indica]|uniref:hypothetical protein n=1 Tax=Sunxiuqinia indica TaxID=2692584 RepID=UPI0013575D4A|nr:hypothetical protein [Sunxiuqinia indica]